MQMTDDEIRRVYKSAKKQEKADINPGTTELLQHRQNTGHCSCEDTGTD